MERETIRVHDLPNPQNNFQEPKYYCQDSKAYLVMLSKNKNYWTISKKLLNEAYPKESIGPIIGSLHFFYHLQLLWKNKEVLATHKLTNTIPYPPFPSAHCRQPLAPPACACAWFQTLSPWLWRASTSDRVAVFQTTQMNFALPSAWQGGQKTWLSRNCLVAFGFLSKSWRRTRKKSAGVVLSGLATNVVVHLWK